MKTADTIEKKEESGTVLAIHAMTHAKKNPKTLQEDHRRH